jgi:hypothetical protein
MHDENLEKLIFLEMTRKVMKTLPTTNDEYLETYNKLSDNEKTNFGILSKQIHRIYTEINTNTIPNAKVKLANSILEYNENVEKIDPLILKCHLDFGVTLKSEINDKFKIALINFLGEKFYNDHFNK